MKKPLSIRQSLLFGLIFLVVFVSGALLISTVIRAFKTSEALANEVIAEAGLGLINEVEGYFWEVGRSLEIVKEWAQNQNLQPQNEQDLGYLLPPLIEASPRISSVMLASSSGAEMLFLQDPFNPALWTSRLVDPLQWRGKAKYKRWDSTSNLIKSSLEPINYDTKGRAYYRRAVEAELNQTRWTEPAVFFITRDPGMTAVQRWTAPNGDTLVLGFDVLLLDLCRLTMNLPISEHGYSFMFTKEDDRLIALPPDSLDQSDEGIRRRLGIDRQKNLAADAKPQLPVAGRSGNTALDTAHRAWQKAGRKDTSFGFTYNEERWLANFSSLEVGNHQFVMAAVAPQADFMKGLAAETRQILLFTLIALLIAVALASFLAIRFAKPLELLAAGSRRLQRFDLSDGEEGASNFREIRTLQLEQEKARVALSSFVRYLPMEIVRELVAKGEVARIGGERRVITVLFTDIEGFTSISESRSAEAVTHLLSEYLEALLETIRKHGGEVNQLLGDGVEVYWGAPLPNEAHAQKAVEGILAGFRAIEELNTRFIAEGKPPLPTRFGAATGELMIGNVGSKSRLSYTAIGDTANLASRIEGLNRFYGTRLLVADSTRESAGPNYEWRLVDRVRVKGRSQPVDLYEPLGKKGEVKAQLLQFRNQYEQALKAYQNGEFHAVLEELQMIPPDYRNDKSFQRLKELAVHYLQNAKEEDWEGVTNYLEK